MQNKKFFTNWTMWLILPLLAVVAWVMVATGQPRQLFASAPSRMGYDPLSADEQAQAASLALTPASQRAATGRIALVLSERHQEEKSVYNQGTWDRRADVYYYNYDTNENYYALVNLTTGNIDQAETLYALQLPFTPEEKEQAFALIKQDTNLVARIQEEYAVLMPEKPFSFDEISADSFLFDGKRYGITEGALAACGVERCGDFFLSLSNNAVLSIRPIVNLSTNQLLDWDRTLPLPQP